MKAKISIIVFGVSMLLFFACQRNIQGPDEAAFSWPTAAPVSQNIDAQKMAAAFDAASQRSFINGIVVIRNGYLVGERYYNGFDKNDAHNVRSVSKSFLSAMYGLALEQGVLSLNDKIMTYLAEYDYAVQDDSIYDVDILDLLTMRGGFAGDQEAYFTVTNAADWIRTTLAMPLLFNPGSAFKYSTAGTHLLSVILTKAGKRSSLEFATEQLFKPLGIKARDWLRDPLGYYFGGTDMFFTIRDIARFGQLYLDKGAVDGAQLLPRLWVDESIKPSYLFQSGSWGVLEKIGYGRLWWLGEIHENKVYMALGFGGQFILIFPELNMIIATCSRSDNVDWDAADGQERAVLAVVADYFLPALKD